MVQWWTRVVDCMVIPRFVTSSGVWTKAGAKWSRAQEEMSTEADTAELQNLITDWERWAARPVVAICREMRFNGWKGAKAWGGQYSELQQNGR